MASSASSNSTSNWVQKTATHSYLEGDGNQFTGRPGNNACSQIVVEAVKRILSHSPINSSRDIDAIVNTGTANYQVLLDNTKKNRAALAAELAAAGGDDLEDLADIGQANTYFGINDTLDQDPLCKVEHIRDTTLRQKNYRRRSGLYQTSLLTAQHPGPGDIKRCFDKAISDLAAIGNIGRKKRGGRARY